jgi:F0F1-type ATP synthase membrane subunit b/b'
VRTDLLQFSTDNMGSSYKAEIQANHQSLQNQLVQQFKCLAFSDAEKELEKDLNSSARFMIPENSSLPY